MTLSRRDYLAFREIAGNSRIKWIRDRFPEGPPVNWWLFLLDFVESDLSEFRTLDASVRRDSVMFGVDVIELAVSSGSISRLRGAAMLARLAHLAGHVIPEEQLPASLHVDHIVRQCLSMMPLSIVDAGLAAERRRMEVMEDSGATEVTSRGGANAMQRDDDIAKLYEIEEILWALEPILARVADPENRRVLDEWLSSRRNFGLNPPPV